MSLNKLFYLILSIIVVVMLGFVQTSCTFNFNFGSENNNEENNKEDNNEENYNAENEEENKNQEGENEGTSNEGTGEGESENDENDNSDPGNSTTPTHHSVTILGSDGTPQKGLIVELYDTSAQRLSMSVTNAQGTVVFDKYAIGNYTFDISSSDKTFEFYYDVDSCVLSPENTSVTITVYTKLLTKTETVYGPGIESENGAKAYKVTPGSYALKLSKGITYLVFEPNKSGIFSITGSSTANISVVNYGIPNYVQATSTTDSELLIDNGFKVEVSPLQGDNSVYTPYVIGITADSSVDCVLEIVRVSDLSDNPIYKDWSDLNATEKYLNQFTVEEGKSFVSLDLSDPTLNVVLSSDGYYHLGNANGPVVVVKINEASEYIDSFIKICETSTFGWYHFDEDGNFIKKERFNSMIESYAAICDEATGACPLTEELAYAIKMNGEYHNWWNFAKTENIFGDDAPFIVKDNAWLFACGIIQ